MDQEESRGSARARLHSASWFRLPLLFLLLGLLACGAPSPPEPEEQARTSAPTATTSSISQRPLVRNAVLITVDTLRADTLGFVGHPTATTPNLDQLASEGRVFTNAHAHNVVTLPSHTNILTGLYPYQHGIRDNSGFVLAEEIPTVATLLSAAGWATGAFIAAYPLDSRFGLARGFDTYDDNYPRSTRSNDFFLAERPGNQVVELALGWWNEHLDQQRFLWLHLFDPHAPYEPPEPWASRFREQPYLGEVAAVDAYLAPLLEAMGPDTLVVFTSDHGEALGEHGEPTHGLFTYEPTLKIPLVLKGPGIEPGIESGAAGHVDLAPTLLLAAGLEPPTGWPGHDLLAEPPVSFAGHYFEALSANLNQGWAPLRGWLRDRQKWIELPLPELYDLAVDPAEHTNQAGARADLARSLRSALPGESAWPPTRSTEPGDDPRLRSLGYLAGSAPAKDHYGTEDDPKNLIDLNRRLHRFVELYGQRRLQEAETLGRDIVDERPQMPIGHSLLSQVLLERGHLPDALRVMQSAHRQGVASPSLLRQLALSLARIGKPTEALEVLDGVANTNDPAYLGVRGIALSEAGRQNEARLALEQALDLDPRDPRALEGMGMVALRQQRWQDAERYLEQALAVNPASAEAWNMLAVAKISGPGDSAGALEAWSRSLDLDPEQWDVLYNLGLVAPDLGRNDLAREALRQFLAGAPAERYGPDLDEARRRLAALGG